MKKRYGILKLLLVLALVLGLTATAFADGTGSITIGKAVAGREYTIYRILTLESYDAAADTYAYQAADAAWSVFLNSKGIKDVYVNVDAQGYVTWVKDKATEESAAAFAKLAQAFAADPQNNVTSQGTEKAKSATVKFEGLALGYYLVDSNQGVLCSLDTTNPDAAMEEKNGVPSSGKEVQEDSSNTYGHVNDADIGQVVSFRNTVVTQPGAERYVFHDEMSKGLTFGGSVTVTLDGVAVSSTDYTLKKEDQDDECTFEVIFTQNFCDTLPENGELIISYSAVVNEQAVVADGGNPNKSWLNYGENGKFGTEPSTTRTYTWGMDVLKYANGVEANTLEGVKFVLLNSDKTKVAAVVDGKLTGWMAVPAEGAAWPANTELQTDAKGEISINGLDADRYYLRETEGKPGYNKLADDILVTITGTISQDGKTMTYIRPKEKVNNQSGTLLPSTGGAGTTAFYAVGGILAAGAAVLLVTKKRMEA